MLKKKKKKKISDFLKNTFKTKNIFTKNTLEQK